MRSARLLCAGPRKASGLGTTLLTTFVALSLIIALGQSGCAGLVASKSSPSTTAPPAAALSIATSSLPNGQASSAYSATLSANGGTPPYTWSVAAGSSLPSWLVLNASTGQLGGTPSQSGTASFSIQVMDSSSTPQTAAKVFSVTIAAGPAPGSVSITTSALPFGQVGTLYAVTLAASGGSPPYTWSLVSGSSLPAGLILSVAGTISGTPTSASTSTIKVQVTDSASQSASSSFTMDILSAGACGGPLSYCSRTDLTTVQLPNPLPNMGGTIGANTVITDPDFNNRIVRVTDINTEPGNVGYAIGTGGSADVNVFNTDSTLFVTDKGGLGNHHNVFGFDTTTMQVSQPYGTFFLPDGFWSHSNKWVYYAFGPGFTSVEKFDFSTTTPPTPPTPIKIIDFTSGSNCLPVGYKPQWTDFAGVSNDDTIFTAAYSDTGGQGTGIDVVAWKLGSGCRHWNTNTGQITGDWGPVGHISGAYSLQLHNVRISTGGTWLVAVSSSATGGSGPFFWNIGTLTVNSCANSCAGHWIGGFSNWVNNSTGAMHEEFRPFNAPTVFTELVTNFPATLPSSGVDQHQSWNNNSDGTDTQPFFTTTYGTVLPYPSAWQNEVMGVVHDGTVYRFCHTFNSSTSSHFSTADGIGTVSQDGKWFAFSSDWMGTMGGRGEAFIVELK